MGAEVFVPDSRRLDELRNAATRCRGCDLYRHAEQTVFGEGPAQSSMLLLGEQPGDQEDRRGEPFVGPAGRLLDRALTEAGIVRADVYLTNAVKHFKFVRAERGKRRIHKKPAQSEIAACRPWVLAEIGAVDPRVIVCLGATAAQAMIGSSFRVTRQQGELLEIDVDGVRHNVLATVHPSAVLRSRDRDADFAALVADLKVAAAVE